MFVKEGFKQCLQDFPDNPLGKLVLKYRDSQWSGLSIAFGNVYAAYYFCMILLLLESYLQINEVLFKVLSVFLIGQAINPRGRFLVEVTVGLAEHLTIQKTIQALEALLLISSCRFRYCMQ